MKAWSATDDDLIWLRRSLGIHANEADIEHLPADMVKAYQETHYAKVRAAPPLAPARRSAFSITRMSNRDPGPAGSQFSLRVGFRLTTMAPF